MLINKMTILFAYFVYIELHVHVFPTGLKPAEELPTF